MPLANMFWGDRYAVLRDPFGHSWSMATHVEDVPLRAEPRPQRRPSDEDQEGGRDDQGRELAQGRQSDRRAEGGQPGHEIGRAHV